MVNLKSYTIPIKPETYKRDSNIVYAKYDVSRGGYGNPWLLNYNPAYFSRFKAVYGTRRARLSSFGDSKTIGYSSGTGGSNANEQANSYPTQLAGLLGPTIADQNSVFGWGVGAGGGDIRLTLNSWLVTGGGNLTLGANDFFVNSTDTTSLVFTPPGNVDTCDLWVITNPANGSYTYSIDGGSASAPTSTNATAGILKHSISLGSLGQHSIAINRFSGTMFFLGFECYDSTKKYISILNNGSAGTTSANQIDNTHGYAPLGTIVTFAPDGIIYDIGTNDLATSVPSSTTQANIQTWLNNILPTSDVILAVTAPMNTDIAPAVAQVKHQQMIQNLAISNNLICVDLMQLFGSWAAANAQGWYSNDTHPSALGYRQIAQAYQTVINKILFNV